MGCFYTGFDYKNRKNGYWKIGESSKSTPAQRLAQIRQSDSFQCLGYLILINDTKPQRLFVESYVRMKLESIGLEHTQNDHFLYAIRSDGKYEQADEIAKKSIDFAIEACKIAGIQYKIGKRKYKRS